MMYCWIADAVGSAAYSVVAGGSVASGGGRSSYAGGRASRAGPPSVVTVSERGSVASGSMVAGSILAGIESTERLTPQQLGVMGELRNVICMYVRCYLVAPCKVIRSDTHGGL